MDEIDSMVRAVLQSNKLGTSLVKTLRIQADTLRKKRRQNIHAQILKAPVKLIFPLLFFIFPTLVIIIERSHTELGDILIFEENPSDCLTKPIEVERPMPTILNVA